MANETVQGLEIRVTVKGRVKGLDGVFQDVDIDDSWSFTDGTAANQVGAVFLDKARSLAATNETLDLDGLSGVSGSQSDNNNVKVTYVKNLSSTPGQDLTVGGGDWLGPFADATDKIKVRAGGALLCIAPLDGFPITASSGDGLRLENAATFTFNVFLGFDNT